MKRIFQAAIAATVLALSSTAGAETTLRLAFNAPIPVWGRSADLFAQKVAERSGGELRIQVFGNGQLGSLPQTIGGLRTGQVDMILTDTGGVALAKGAKDLSALSAPYAFRDRAHFRAFMTSAEWRAMLAPAEQEGGFRYVGFVSERLARQLTTATRKVTTPDYMKGLKIRVPENPLILETIKAWGAAAVPVPGSELYLALKQGLVEGQDNGFDSVVGAKFYEVQKYGTRLDYIQSGLIVLMSGDKWNRLTPAQQKALGDAAADAEKVLSAEQNELETKSLATLKANGMEIVEPDLAPFKKIAEDVNRRFDGQAWAKGTLERIRAVK